MPVEEDKDYKFFIETDGKHYEIDGIQEIIVKGTCFYNAWLIKKAWNEFKEDVLSMFRKFFVKIRLFKE